MRWDKNMFMRCAPGASRPIAKQRRSLSIRFLASRHMLVLALLDLIDGPRSMLLGLLEEMLVLLKRPATCFGAVFL